MDFSSLPQPTAGKKDWRPQLIGFVNDWGTAERWLQSDKTWWSLKSTKEFPKVMQMLLLTRTWSLAEGNASAIWDPWMRSSLVMHRLLCWGPTPLENVSPALLSQTLRKESNLPNLVIFSVAALQSLRSFKGADSTGSTKSVQVPLMESSSTKKRVDVNNSCCKVAGTLCFLMMWWEVLPNKPSFYTPCRGWKHLKSLWDWKDNAESQEIWTKPWFFYRSISNSSTPVSSGVRYDE